MARWHIAFALAAVAAALLMAGIASGTKETGYFTANNMSYRFTYVYTTPAEWQQGLMNSTAVTNATFALFDFGRSGSYSFWMKNTYVPLDMIWVNGSRVVYIVNGAEPCIYHSKSQANCTIYTPGSNATYVIEAKAGFAKRNGIAIGSAITVHLNR